MPVASPAVCVCAPADNLRGYTAPSPAEEPLLMCSFSLGFVVPIPTFPPLLNVATAAPAVVASAPIA